MQQEDQYSDIQQIADMSGGGPSPFETVFYADQPQVPLGLMREMFKPGDSLEDLMLRSRASQKEAMDFAEMFYEEAWIESEGNPDEETLLRTDIDFGIARDGQSRHEVLQMYTRMLTDFIPQQMQMKAHRFAMRRTKDEQPQ